MKVVALSAGFANGSRVREGQEFEMPDGAKGAWFVPVDQMEELAPKRKGKGKAQPSTLSELGRASGDGFNDAMAGD